jgi:hypothetical protein
MDFGSNLAKGLVFQAALWLVLIGILWDLFFRAPFRLKNLAFFSFFLGLSAPQYHELPNPLGAGNLLVAGALILLVNFRLHGVRGRYVIALAMLGFVPLIQFAGLILVAGIVAGLLASCVMLNRSKALHDVALAVIVPALVSGAGYWLAIVSWPAFTRYFRGCWELASGYDLAMALRGSPVEVVAGLEAIALLAVALLVVASSDRRTALFLGLLFAVPVFVSAKHSFVRQDEHVVYIFSFVALASALAALAGRLENHRATMMGAITFLFAVLCLVYIVRVGPGTTITEITGVETPRRVWRALWFGDLRQQLYANAQRSFTANDRVEPEIKSIVQHEPVASLSVIYNSYLLDDMNLVLSPVLQRYSAYTPYLDGLNAQWVRDRGPRFLIFDGRSIDGRNAWTETPAMWAEVYRWYDTRTLGTRNLLLERRTVPRFLRLEPLTQEPLRFGDDLRFPTSREPIFWSMHCSLTKRGRLRELLFRVSEIMMRRDTRSGTSDSFRVLPAVLGAPSMGTYLPHVLPEFAALLEPTHDRTFLVEALAFGGPGASSYSQSCDVEFLRPVR